MLILPTDNLSWSVAKKTRPVRAKPMVNLLVSRDVMSKFLIDTLEGREPVSANALFCIGESNDAWQQTPEKLLAKYNVVNIDNEGWLMCEPKPENSVEFFEVTQSVLMQANLWDAYSTAQCGYVKGQWGETIGQTANLQRFSLGDFVARNRQDTSDQWVVRRKIWLNTYVALNG